MPRYKMLCLDLDGTLFTSKRRFSPRTAAAVMEAERVGVEAVIATGRSLFEARHFGYSLHGSGYVIGANGAAIGDLAKATPILTVPFGDDELDFLRELVGRCKIEASWFSSDAIYTQGRKVSFLYRAIARASHGAMGGKIFSASSSSMRNIQKCNLFGIGPDESMEIADCVSRNGAFSLVFTGGGCAEITAKGVNKASGIEVIAEMRDISPSEIIAIGDSENDIEMIRYAGLGVAMGNAVPALKNAADYVTASNDADGVARVIERFILEN